MQVPVAMLYVHVRPPGSSEIHCCNDVTEIRSPAYTGRRDGGDDCCNNNNTIRALKKKKNTTKIICIIIILYTIIVHVGTCVYTPYASPQRI